MKHDQSQFEDISDLPKGESLIWQGSPSFRGLALRAFHIREVALYFGLLMVWRLASAWSNTSPQEAIVYAAWLLAPAAISITILATLAWMFARAARYTITSKRVVLQFGVALPMTMNIPLGKIRNAALKTYRDGSGDIPLTVSDDRRVSFLLLWPHVRPWRLRVVEPMLRAVPDAATVAARLSEALSGQPGPSALSMRSTGVMPATEAFAASPHRAAA